MKGFLRALAVLWLAAAAVLPAGAQTFFQGAFNLAEAYPCTIGTYDAAAGITDPQVFSGSCAADGTAELSSRGAMPGILSLQRSGVALDVNCFTVIPFGQTGPCMVQSYRLTKIVPGSYKCPDVYGPPLAGARYFQFGAGVRTWWSLNFTQPGTQFMLDVVSVCREIDANGVGHPRIHSDLWIWRVVADVETLGCLIDLMHTGAVSTLEVPCILGEDMYDALKRAQQRLAAALSAAEPDTMERRSALFDFEALVLTNCLFTDALQPLVFFPGADQFGAPNVQPPGNLAATVGGPGGTMVAGLIDTTEHPCCCKLIVDLEWIAVKNGISDQGILPPF